MREKNADRRKSISPSKAPRCALSIEELLIFKPSNHETSKALCHSRVPFFIVEQSVVMVYNKLLNFAGVTGDPGML